MKRLFALALVACTTVLTACGGGNDDAIMVATTDTTLAASPATTAAATEVPFAFTTGVPQFGTTAETSVAFTSTATSPAFSIASGGNLATGTTDFGSCIFKVSGSTFPASSPLGNGKQVTIDPCNFNVGTAGQTANGIPTTGRLMLQLGAVSSRAATITITISVTGSVAINGVTAGTVTVAPVSG